MLSKSLFVQILRTGLVVRDDPVAHKLQDEDEQSGGQAEHADLQPQGLHFEMLKWPSVFCSVNHLISVITTFLFVDHNEKLRNVGLSEYWSLTHNTTVFFFLILSLRRPAPAGKISWFRLEDILSLKGRETVVLHNS